MNPDSKKSGIKVNPMEGRFFDIKPPAKNLRRLPAGHRGGFGIFVLLALVAFIVIGISNTYYRAKDMAFESRDAAMSGYNFMQSGIQSLTERKYEKAFLWFDGAEKEFRKIDANVRSLTAPDISFADTNAYVETAQKLTESAILVARAGQKIARLTQNLSALPQKLIDRNTGEEGDGGVIPLIYTEKERFDGVLSDMRLLQKTLDGIDAGILPDDMKIKLEKGQNQLAEIIAILTEIDAHFEAGLELLGDKTPHRYLVLFQNNHELRAAGGFIGSYMIIDVNDGKITKMEAKDVYETDGWLADVVAPPPGIDQVAEKWYMRDANYSPDFAVSAEKVAWFLEHSRGPSVDTVLAIDQDVIETVLQIIGPIHSPHFPFQVTAENFNKIISFHTEAKISETSTPKQLLFDLVPVVAGRLSETGDLTALKTPVLALVAARHIQMYSKDPAVESLIERLKIDGKMPPADTAADFLSIITTSIGGNKSDQYIHTNIAHNTSITAGGAVTDQLIVTKKHTWAEADFSGWQELAERYGMGEEDIKTLRFIQGEGDNKDYMRVYVPKGSHLISTENIPLSEITISEDLGYTVFGFVFGPVKAENAFAVRLTYQLPYSLSSPSAYRFTARKQAGAKNITLSKTLRTPSRSETAEAEFDTDFKFSF